MRLAAQTLRLMEDDHLIASVHAAYDSLTATPLERELLRRLEHADDPVTDDIRKVLDEYDVTADEIRKLGEHVPDLQYLLDVQAVLDEHDIDSITDLREALEIARANPRD